MAIWRNSSMETFYASADAVETEPCEVRVSGNNIVVSYGSAGDYITYEGIETGEGHFKLHAPHVGGRATLHRLPGEDVLEGWWFEDGLEGMWRIHLDDEA